LLLVLDGQILQSILNKIVLAQEQINSITNEEKKELLANVLEYLKETITTKIIDLQNYTDLSGDTTEILNGVLNE